MANHLNELLNFLSHYKYLITIVVGLLVVGVLDENSFRMRVKYELQINELKDQIRKYETLNRVDTRKLQELRRNPKSIEKIAREDYFMKANGEDIFVLRTDEAANQNNDNDNDQEDGTTR